MKIGIPLLRAVLLAVALQIGGAAAHEGHDHAAEAKTQASVGARSHVEASSGPFELVGVLHAGELLIYLERFESNAPIKGAVISVETPDGSVAAKEGDGLYRLPAPWAKAGSHDLIFSVAAAGTTEVLIGTLAVPPDVASPSGRSAGLVGPALTARLQEAPLANLALASLASFIAGVLVARLRRPSGRAVLLLAAGGIVLFASNSAPAHEGHDHGPASMAARPAGETAQRLADGSLFVPKSVQRILGIRTTVTEIAAHRRSIDLPGRIIADPNAIGFVQAAVSGRLSPPDGGFPKLGTRVKAGDVLAFVTPPFQAIDVSDMRQKAGELEQQISIVERRIARYESLVATGAATKVALDEAVLELRGLKERRASLDKVKIEPERLVAPVSGIIAAANAAAGQIAETNAVVFQIIDPGRLWVEALTFSQLPDAEAATARTSDGRSLALAFEGAGLTDRSQAIPVHFSVRGDTNSLRVGQLVTVLAPTGEAVRGLAVSRASIVRASNGQMIAFEHTTAERFEARLVRAEPLDAERMLILDGLQPGKRVVLQGAELLNQIR
jgi:membrane fusion protein, heavy metal efflux system